MSVPLVVAVDILSASSSSSIGLNIESISHIGHVYINATPESLLIVISYISSNAINYSISVNVTSLTELSQITALLDSGASRVFISFKQLQEIKSEFDECRLVLLLDSESQSQEKIIDSISNTSVGLYAHSIVDVEFITGWLQEYGSSDRPPVYVSFATPPALEDVIKIRKLGATLIISSTHLTIDTEMDTGLVPAADAFMASVSSDRLDKLIPTLVVDEQGVALGFVYSSLLSLKESLKTGTGVYHSRKRGLWYKGATSGAVQELIRVDLDCDQDCLRFIVRQRGTGFCHLDTATCFGNYWGLSKLQKTLESRKGSAPAGSYTARLFSDEKLLRAKIMEEAEELCDAKTKQEISFEAADLIYFTLTKCVGAGVSLGDVERNLDAKSLKVQRRAGDAKEKWAYKEIQTSSRVAEVASDPSVSKSFPGGRIEMQRFKVSSMSAEELKEVLARPIQKTTDIMGIVTPIISEVRLRGDQALLDYATKLDRVENLQSPVVKAPFKPEQMNISDEVKNAIDISFENIKKFHASQKEEKPLIVETMPGVCCSRFVRAIERVGLYVPGGTAVLPSTALMLGVPAQVAGCKKIIIASPPRKDGSVTPEIVYVAHKVGAEAIVLAGGAQAIAALAYGTESVPKVDKILGPGNQFVTAGKMFVSNDTSASVSIDMPAGPSEVLVVADRTANPAFVASDLLSQAEHGADSQVILIAVDLSENQLKAIEDELHSQAIKLPRVEIIRLAIRHSVTLQTRTVEEALELSNRYAPEHLILQVQNARKLVDHVENAGSVFIGPWTPESIGDYSAGVNHSLPTYGYARQYSGVNLATYIKHITSSELTEEGLINLGGPVTTLANVEELEAHRRAVTIRLDFIDKNRQKQS